MKPGDLLFVKPHTFIGHSISLMTGEGYSHVAMAVSPNLIFEAQYGTVSRITGIYFDDYDLVEMDLTDEQRDFLVGYVLDSDVLGREYDYKEIFGWTLQLILSKFFKVNIVKYFDNIRDFICLEAILNCYKNALNIELVPGMEDCLVLFKDLYNNPFNKKLLM